MNAQTIATENKPTAIVHFRTMALGSFKRLRPGQYRGWWRTLVVRDPKGSKNINSKNVIEELYSGREGIEGVTEKSRYYIGHQFDEAKKIADQFNAKGAK